MQKQSIKFRFPWRGREPGQIDDALDYGVAVELVRRGIAEYVTENGSQQSEKQSAKKFFKRR